MKPIKAVAVLLIAALAACESEAPPTAETTPPAGSGQGAGSGAGQGIAQGPAPDSPEYFRQIVGDRVFFGTDQYVLDDVSMITLDRQAEWLIANPSVRVTIEGHADERGTRQYNLALGARRSNAAQRYLAQRGVQPDRIRAVTMGKERPVALCSEERCWSQNRRSVTVITAGPVS